MSNFSYDNRHFAEPQRPVNGSSKTIWIVLGVLLLMGLFACAGFGTAIYLVIQAGQKSHSASFVPDVTSDFQADAEAFNRALQHKIAERTANPNVISDSQVGETNSSKTGFVNKELESVRNDVAKYVESLKNSDGPILLDKDGFRDTIEKRAKIDFLNSVSLKLALQQGSPEAESEGHGTLLGVDVDPDQMSATAHWLFYSTANHAMSVQWFLAKKQNRWVVYDWQRLEYGRRYSEEFANYYANLDKKEVDGYDEVLEELVKAIDQTDEIKRKRILRAAERKKVLAKDFDEARLRLCWTYMQCYEFEEAKRVLLALRQRNKLWGFYPTLAHVELSLGNSDAHIEAARQFAQLSPDHPIANSMIGEYELDRHETSENYRKLLNAWALCPKDYSCLQTLSIGLPESLAAELLHVAWRCDSSGETLGIAADELAYNGALTDTLLDSLVESKLVEQKWLDFLQLRVEAEQGRLTDRHESLVLTMRRSAEGALKVAIDDWYMTKCFDDERFETILADEDLAAKVLERVATDLEYDEWYASTDKIVAALENASPQLQRHPLFKGVLGGVLATGDDPRAVGILSKYLEEYKDQDQSVIQDEEFDSGTFAEWVESTLGMAMAKAGRGHEAVMQFADNDSVLSNVVDVALAARDGEKLNTLRDELNKLDRPYTSHLVAKITAYLSYWGGDSTQGDRSFADACKSLKASGAEDESPNWMVAQLARVRGEFAARSQFFDLPFEMEEVGTKEMIQSLIDECGRLTDSNGLNKIIARLEPLNLNDREIELSIVRANLKIATELQSGRDVCIKYLEELLELETHDVDDWYWESNANRLFRLYAEAGRWDDCDKLMLEFEEKKLESLFEKQLFLLLARDRQEDVESLLSNADDSDVSSALLSPSIRRLLSAKPALRGVISRFTVELPHQWISEDMRFNSATVGLSGPSDISEVEVQRVVAKHLPTATMSILSLPEPIVSGSKVDDSASKSRGWKIESSEGDTIYFVLSTGIKTADSTTPLPFREKLASVQHWLHVVVAESKRHPFQLQWNIANELAGDAIVIQWDHGLRAIWYAEPFKMLGEDPKRIPVTPNTLTEMYLIDEEIKVDQGDAKYLDWNDTKRALANGETVEVECDIYSFGLIVGKCRAKVIQLDRITNRIEAELLEEIAIDPLFQPGQRLWLEGYQGSFSIRQAQSPKRLNKTE